MFLIATAFFVCCFLYLWIVVEPGLIYFAFGDLIDFPQFFADTSFLKDTLTTSGGVSAYLSNFLSQLFFYPWAASLIITSVALGFWICTYQLIKSIGNIRSRIFSFLPALTVVLLCSSYNDRLKPLVALLISLAFSVIYLKIQPKLTVLKVAVFTAMFTVLYCATAGPSLMFAFLIAAYELSRSDVIAAALNLLIASLAAYLLGTRLFLLDTEQSYLKLVPILPFVANLRVLSVLYIYLLLPALVVFYAVRQKVLSIKSTGDKKESQDEPLFATEWSRFIAATVLLTAITTAAMCFAFDANRKDMFVMTSLFRQHKWDKFVEVAREYGKSGDYDVRINYEVNFALYHLGRLSDEMFSHQQKGNGLFLFGREQMTLSSQYLRQLDICYELGDTNSAEHWTYELLESEGPSPLILERLAEINLVKAQIGAARVFLNALSKDLIRGEYARQRLALLRKDPDLKTDGRIQYLRSCRYKKDMAPKPSNPEKILLDLLDANPKNRMAFEYLMATYLLTHNLPKLADNLYRMDDMDYERIPTHWQEALLVYMTSRKNVNLYGRSISNETKDRYSRYIAIRRKHRNNRNAAFAELADDHGNSYFFYRTFNVSGAGR